MANFHICHVCINEFHHIYKDLIRALKGSLEDLGHGCSVAINRIEPDALNILLGSTIFASRYNNLPALLAGRPFVVFQLEQLDKEHGLLAEWPEYFELLRQSTYIFEYAPFNMPFHQQMGFEEKTFLVPPGFHRSMERFRPREAADIDVLYYGSPHGRRHQVLQALKNQGVKLTYLQGTFGPHLDRYIRRAKIVLNVHAWSGLDVLETVRLSFLLANRCFVISEEADHNPYGSGVVYAPYDALVSCCLDYLGKSFSERDSVAQEGYLAIRRIDLVSVLRESLARMNIAPFLRRQGDGAVDWGSPVPMSRPRTELIELVPDDARVILDIGCGTGALGAELRRRRPRSHVTGLERNPEAARLAAESLNLVVAGNPLDVLKTLPINSYDVVIMAGTLESGEDVEGLLHEANERLRLGGVLVLSVSNIRHWPVIHDLLKGDGKVADASSRKYSLKGLRNLLDQAGFVIVKKGATAVDSANPPPKFAATLAEMGIESRDGLQEYSVFEHLLVCSKV